VTDQRAVEDYDRGTHLIDPGYVKRNTAITLQLPELPTFHSIGVNLDYLRSINKPSLSQTERVILQDEVAKINTELNILKVKYANEIAQGYFPSPDFDEERFSWIQNADNNNM